MRGQLFFHARLTQMNIVNDAPLFGVAKQHRASGKFPPHIPTRRKHPGQGCGLGALSTVGAVSDDPGFKTSTEKEYAAQQREGNDGTEQLFTHRPFLRARRALVFLGDTNAGICTSLA